MSEDFKQWILYANKNYKAAQLALENLLFNFCLQESQQAIEKSIKAVYIKNKIFFSKTHSIK